MSRTKQTARVSTGGQGKGDKELGLGGTELAELAERHRKILLDRRPVAPTTAIAFGSPALAFGTGGSNGFGFGSPPAAQPPAPATSTGFGGFGPTNTATHVSSGFGGGFGGGFGSPAPTTNTSTGFGAINNSTTTPFGAPAPTTGGGLFGSTAPQLLPIPYLMQGELFAHNTGFNATPDPSTRFGGHRGFSSTTNSGGIGFGAANTQYTAFGSTAAAPWNSTPNGLNTMQKTVQKEEEQNQNVANNKPETTGRITIYGIGIVDPLNDMKDTTNIVGDIDDNDKDCSYDVLLFHKTINQFILLQLIECKGGGTYYMWTRTRNGEHGVVSVSVSVSDDHGKVITGGKFDNMYDASICFRKIFESKTGLTWEQRDKTPKVGKYSVVQSLENSGKGLTILNTGLRASL